LETIAEASVYPGILIAAARRRIKQAVLSRLGDRGLTPQQFWILVAIRENPGISQTGIASRTLADPPTISRALAPLVARGLARAEPDPDDRRRTRLSLSPAGQRLARALLPVAQEIRATIVAGMSASEIAALNAALGRVVANLDRLERRRSTAEERP
jgi:DNA-binding MarR family transcriptional regulator